MMNAIKLTLATLCMVMLATSPSAHAAMEYELQCTSSEVGLRWPSYTSNSQYYICQREGGKVMTVSCNPGEVFTFVMQACTTYSKFIPPPPMNALPTSSPALTTGNKNGNGNGNGGSIVNGMPVHNNNNVPPPEFLPKPYYPDHDAKPAPPSPPIIGMPMPPQVPSPNGDIPSPPIANSPQLPPLFNNGLMPGFGLFPHNASVSVNTNGPKHEDLPPMPSIAEPTPPVVGAVNGAQAETEKKPTDLTKPGAKLPSTGSANKPVQAAQSKKKDKTEKKLAAGQKGSANKGAATSTNSAAKSKDVATVKKGAAAAKKGAATAKKSAATAKTGAATVKKSATASKSAAASKSKSNAASGAKVVAKNAKNTKLEKNSKTKKPEKSPAKSVEAKKGNKASPVTAAKKAAPKKPAKAT